MRLNYIPITILVGSLITGLLVANAYYRWDQKVFASVAYRTGIETDWYDEQEVSIRELGATTIEEFEKKLLRQGFEIENAPGDDGEIIFTGFHHRDGELRWYTFAVNENAKIYRKDYLTAWGLCSQTAGVEIRSDNTKAVRLLNPGETCV